MSRDYSPPPVVSGIYMLFTDHRLIYIGKSTDVYRRIADHRTNGRTFDYATVTSVPDIDLGWVERALIEGFNPPSNKSLSPKNREPVAPLELERSRAAPAPITIYEPSTKAAMTVKDFCHDYGIGRTKVFEELATGRLKKRKLGRRTVILRSDAEAWLAGLST